VPPDRQVQRPARRSEAEKPPQATGTGFSPKGLDRYAPDKLVQMLRQMMLIHAFDLVLPSLYTAQLTRGSSHAALGQEAVAVGACAALRPDDLITSTHRGHGHAIAKGADVNRMMAELLGRVDGYCHGKGGSMHIADFSIGMLGANGIVGGGFGIAGGAALSASMRKTDQVVLCFFGDGAINQGSFYEVANMAAIWKLPLVLLCENNQFAMSARPDDMISVADLAQRAAGFGFPGKTLNGMDVLAVLEGVQAAVERARSGEGPSLVVATCYRSVGHFSGDALKYRDASEANSWRSRDPILNFIDRLVLAGIVSLDDIKTFQMKATLEIQSALTFAKASPLPDPAEAWEDVYA